MSCAVTRRRAPARRTLPSRTLVTFNRSPMMRTSSPFPLNAKALVRAATRSEGSFASALMISSLIPSLMYSFSGSVLMFANARTAIERPVPGGDAATFAVSAAAKSAAVAKRASGSRAIARASAAATASGTGVALPLTWIEGAVAVKRFAIMA